MGRKFLQGGRWLLIFAWIIFIYASYIYFQQTNILWGSVAETIFRIFLLFLFFLVSAALGKKIFRWLKFESGSFLESFLFGLAIGLAIFTYAVIGFALAGLLNRWVINLFFVGMFVLAYKEVGDIIGQIKAGGKAITTLRIPSLEIVLLLLLALQVFFNLAGASVFPSGWDSLGEHLAKAKEWNRLHSLASIPYINLAQWAQPFNVGILYGMALFIKDAILAQLIHFAFGLLTAVGVYALGKRYFSSRVGLMGATIFYTVPIVAYMSTTAYVDLGLTFYTFFAFYALVRWVSSGKKGWLLVSAILSGLALGSKYAGFPFMAILSLGILLGGWWVKKEKSWRIMRDFFIFLALGILTGSFWYLRAYFIGAHSVFPGMWQRYLLRFWQGVKELWVSAFSHPGVSQPAFALDFSLPQRIISLSWNVSMHKMHGYGAMGIVFLAFLPLLIFPRFRRSRLIKFMLFYSVLYFILWATLASVKRYLIPILPLSGIMIGYMIEQIPGKGIFLKRSIYTLLIVTFLFQIVYLAPEGLNKVYQRCLVFSGLKSQEGYILENEVTYPVFKYVNENLPLEAKLWIIYEPRTFYCNRSYVTSLKLRGAYTQEAILVKLKREGITHIVFNQDIWGFIHHSREKYPRMINMLQPDYLRPLYEKYPFTVWRVSYPELLYAKEKLFPETSLSLELSTVPRSHPYSWNAKGRYLIMCWAGGVSSEIFLFPRGHYKVEVVARGTPLQGVYPQMRVLWEGEWDEEIGTFSVSENWQKYTTRILNLDSPTLGWISVGFTNDACGGGEDRNLYIKEVIIRRLMQIPEKGEL